MTFQAMMRTDHGTGKSAFAQVGPFPIDPSVREALVNWGRCSAQNLVRRLEAEFQKVIAVFPADIKCRIVGIPFRFHPRRLHVFLEIAETAVSVAIPDFDDEAAVGLIDLFFAHPSIARLPPRQERRML